MATADNLRLPIDLYHLRRRSAGNGDINAELDEAFHAVNQGNVAAAAAIMDKYRADRNAKIRAHYRAGEILEELAAEYGISHQRIHQIVHFQQP